ncbi:MAG: chemotaxis protein CheA [Oscillospiraceae bacterium]
MARFDSSMEAMVDMFIFETTTLLEQLDEILMKTERENAMGEEDINEIFRIMHTIKGSAAMMGLDNMSTLSHAIEDMFYILRENKTINASITHLYELVFDASDLLKAEVDTIQDPDSEPTDFSELKSKIKDYIVVLKSGGGEPLPKVSPTIGQAVDAIAQAVIPQDNTAGQKQTYSGVVSVRVFFEDGCQMENLRALLLVNTINDDCEYLEYEPTDIETNPDSAKIIIDDGFLMHFKAHDSTDLIIKHIEESVNVKSYEIIEAKEPAAACASPVSESASQKTAETVNSQAAASATAVAVEEKSEASGSLKTETEQTAEKINSQLAQTKGGNKQSLISVNLNKLDTLLDMVGELVITQAMVTSNPDLKGLKLDSFQKASRQLRKLTDELQDIVMSIRMVPLSGVFNKMSRIVRDMKMKLNKNVELVFEGEETEVDKSVIDNLTDPLMHLVRNAMDHGIETPEEYAASGKTEKSQINLSAYNSSGEVVILVQDNGKGINPQKVLEKAKANGILTKPDSEYSDKEIYNLIMLPGFSLKENVTEFSGRGVGTDVVKKNIEKIGGSVTVDSRFGEGTCFIIKIPLSLAIVDGMEVSVGDSIFTIPTSSIMESFKLKPEQLLHDTEKGEMIMIRGKCYPLIRLYENYGLEPKSTELESGIVILVEADSKRTCLFVDELIGEQQVVVKPFSPLLNRFSIKQKGMAGCSILGDGSITIILDINNIVNEF